MTPTLQAVAWTLIHFSWQAAAIAALYRLAAMALTRVTSNTRYVAALASLLLMLAAALFTFSWEMRSGAPGSISAGSTGGYNFSPVVTPATGPVTGELRTAGSANSLGASLSQISLAARVESLPVIPWIDGLWMAGVLALSLRSLGGWWLLRRLCASANLEAPPAASASFHRIAAVLGVSRPVLLRISSAIAGPLTVGAFRVLVLLPLSAAASLSPDELEMVLAHELAHVRRADFLWNLLQTLVETLFFFHPAVWWIGGRIRHERELCCDDLALDVCPNPVAYANALFRLEVARSGQHQLAMALDGNQSTQTLRLRIARILGEPAQAANRGRFSLASAAALLLVVLLPVPHVLASLNPARAAVTAPAVASAVAHYAAPAEQPAVAALSHRIAGEAVQPMLQDAAAEPQEKPRAGTEAKGDYIDQMKAAGYDVDLDKYIAMKVQDITVEYVRAMNQLGFGKLSADDLIACKVQDVTPEFIAKLKKDGLEVKTVQDAISYRIFEVTPEFVAGMKAAGFDSLTHEQLMALRVQDVTPEYAAAIRKQFPGATVDDIVKTKIFNIDADFIAQAKRHGFADLSLDKLVKLRISGIFDDESVKQ